MALRPLGAESLPLRRVRLAGVEPWLVPGHRGVDRNGYRQVIEPVCFRAAKRNRGRIPTTSHRWRVARAVVDGIMAAEKSWQRAERARRAAERPVGAR